MQHVNADNGPPLIVLLMEYFGSFYVQLGLK